MTELTADFVLFGYEDQDEVPSVLLVQRKYDPFAGYWAIPGGFVEENEDPRHTAVRELREETGIQLSNLQTFLIDVFGAPDRDPRGHVVSIVYAYAMEGRPEPRADDDAMWARWFPFVQAIDELQLAFDHKSILGLAHQILDYANVFDPIYGDAV